MQLFRYLAKDKTGVIVKGKVEARDIESASAILHHRQLIIIKLELYLPSSTIIPLLDSFINRVTSQDIVAFTQQLSTMINSGLPLSDGLSILETQSKPKMAKIVNDILREIQAGSSFAKALETKGQVFSSVYIASIRAGESSGKLDEVLAKLAETEEKRREFNAKTKAALVYPIIVVSVMLVVGIAMMVLVVPKLLAMFTEFGTELPLTTRILIGLSNLAQKTWWLMILIFFGVVYGLNKWYQTTTGREKIDRLFITAPIFGTLQMNSKLADITRTLALLVGAGISILEALEIVTQSAGNVVFEKALKHASSGVEKGLPLATMLAREQLFPPLLPQMVSVGEETGQLQTILIKVSHYFETEAEHAIKNLTTAIEPLIMIILGVGVLFLVLAIIMPIYQLTSAF